MMRRLGVQWRTLLETARRAGLRRSVARVRRIFFLRILYPRLAGRFYPRRVVPLVSPHVFPAFLPQTLVRWDGTVRLVNTEPFALRAPVDWDANPIGHTLWAFRLHEWEWALALIQQAQTEPTAAVELAALLEDYVARVPCGHRIAFEPYPLSRRLVVWCQALCVLSAAQHDSHLLQALASEMDRGARMLADNVEHDLDNNHVIANANALASVGTLLAQSYGRTGFALLWEQLRFQVRADGVHVENSTTYHFLVWRDALEAYLLARRYGIDIPNDIPPRIKAMQVFLDAVRFPDGTFPMLNDSVQDELQGYGALVAEFKDAFEIHSVAKSDFQTESAHSPFPDSGYAILRADDTQLVFDAGVLGPAYCPGHGHADTLSFELVARGRPRIVDSGTYQYQAGEWRDYFRGTAAHNTLQVDGLDSSEVSGSFRVGRMANARMWTERDWVCGEHDGYTRLREPITHARKLQLCDANTLVIHDEIRGRGTHAYALRFHLAPGARATIAERTARIRFEDDAVIEMKISDRNVTMQVGDGWYSPTWYTKVPVPVVELKWRGEPPYELETIIRLSQT